MNKELEEVKRVYKEIKRNKDIIGSIEKDFFFNFGDLVMRELEELREENKTLRIQINSAFDNGFIHKDKIREKYLEMEKEYERKVYDKKYDTYEAKVEEMYKAQVYKELLGVKK